MLLCCCACCAALRLADHIGGHLVSGHVDGLGTVTYFAPVNESHELRVRAPVELGKYLAYKGSVVVNGVSSSWRAACHAAYDAYANPLRLGVSHAAIGEAVGAGK